MTGTGTGTGPGTGGTGPVPACVRRREQGVEVVEDGADWHRGAALIADELLACLAPEAAEGSVDLGVPGVACSSGSIHSGRQARVDCGWSLERAGGLLPVRVVVDVGGW